MLGSATDTVDAPEANLNEAELKLEEEMEESHATAGESRADRVALEPRETNAGAEKEKPEELTDGRMLEVYFQNFQLNYRRTDISFKIEFEAFFEDNSPIMKKTLQFGSQNSLNKVD